MSSKKLYIILAIDMSLIWEMIKKKNRKEPYAHVFHETFCLKTIFSREGMPFEKNEVAVRLTNSLFLYNHEVCKHNKAHLSNKIRKF